MTKGQMIRLVPRMAYLPADGRGRAYLTKRAAVGEQARAMMDKTFPRAEWMATVDGLRLYERLKGAIAKNDRALAEKLLRGEE